MIGLIESAPTDRYMVVLDEERKITVVYFAGDGRCAEDDELTCWRLAYTFYPCRVHTVYNSALMRDICRDCPAALQAIKHVDAVDGA